MILEFLKKHDLLLYGLAALSAVAFTVAGHPGLAMWFGFALAGYSAIANDSIQTLGTFLTTNRKRPWWALWLFIGGILVAVNVYGFLKHDGAIDFHRLSSIPQPESFTFLQLLAPIVLIALTKMRMPVSTSFLLLSSFGSAKTVQDMLGKTFLGYVIAFVVAFLLWSLIARWSRAVFRNPRRGSRSDAVWTVLQWTSTGFLWSQWLMQDTANVAVFLPRSLSFPQFLVATGFLFLVMGYLMYIRGDRIQEVVTKKKDITGVRSATVIDFVFALILLYFKNLNHIPMSTTWVFLGLLAGRELALTEASEGTDTYAPFRRSLRLVGDDIVKAGIGLAVSLVLAFFINAGFSA